MPFPLLLRLRSWTLSLLLLLSPQTLPPTQQTPSPSPAQLLDQIEAATKALRGMIVSPILTAHDLQTALLTGGDLTLEAGVTYQGNFVIAVSGTTLHGAGATLTSPNTLPPLFIPPSIHNILVEDLVFTAPQAYQRVVQVGANDLTQTQVAQVPTGITFTRVGVPAFRGKRAFEFNGEVTLQDSFCHDVYDPTVNGSDSQCVGIFNTTGKVVLTNNDLDGGSEVVLVGGDTLKLSGIVAPQDIRITGNRLRRPLTQQTDGVVRKLKNLIEIKTGIDVLIAGNIVSGSWVDAQDGYAILLTPHSGGVIRNALVRDNLISEVAACFQLLGQEYKGIPTALPLTAAFTHNSCTASKALYGGRGILALVSGEPEALRFEGNQWFGDGTSVILYDAGKVLTGAGILRAGGPIGTLTLLNNLGTTGVYGLMLGGTPNAGPPSPWVTTLQVEGNTFLGAATLFKTRLPANTYVDKAGFDLLWRK